jgi:tetratricopeptide (TPR) repeat protein
VVLARQGDNAAAIEKYRHVIEDRWSDATSATRAAAYSEWGFSLALLGRANEGFAKFEKATKEDAGFADVYTSWAEVLSALGRGAEADAMTRRALRLAPTEVIYTENLVGPVQHLPATASAAN